MLLLDIHLTWRLTSSTVLAGDAYRRDGWLDIDVLALSVKRLSTAKAQRSS